ncbi:hypothetical protein GF386_06780, partial [Candidatus Pacearchaeota archaeon]|nr:hypothetical protein [Candidatus Pacearchaeota archaeon]
MNRFWNKRSMAKIGAISIIGILLIGLILGLLIVSLGSAVIEKNEYILGEKVKIDLTDKNYKLKIITPSDTFFKEGYGGAVIFEPEELGKYILETELDGENEVYEFEVIDELVVGEKESDVLKEEIDDETFEKDEGEKNLYENIGENENSPEKSLYSLLKKGLYKLTGKNNQPEDLIDFDFSKNNSFCLGEKIRINLRNFGNYEINIFDSSGEKFSRKGSNDFFIFEPEEPEVYKIEIWKDGGKEEYRFNIYEEPDVTDSGISEDIYLVHEKAEINKPVRWIKRINGSEKEYITEGPKKIEKILPGSKEKIFQKEVKVYSPPDVSYENVLSYTEIKEILPLNKKNLIKVYWKEENKYLDFEVFDENSNGMIDKVEWVVPHLSNQTFEIGIDILNVKSYPAVGGNWTVRFETFGKADLLIKAINNTFWDNQSYSEDLKFLEIRCGNESLGYEWIDGGVFIRDYECNETGFEISKVITRGKHDLEFNFGDVKAYAHNTAGELPHVFIEQTSAQTRTGVSSWGDISGAVIDSGNFTAGRKYLIVATAQIGMNDGAGDYGARLLHGSAAFTGSDHIFDPYYATSSYMYFWFTVWTAVEGEDVQLQHITLDSSDTVSTDQVTILAIELSEILTEDTDWFFDEDASSTGLSDSWSSSNNAEIQFTPNSNSEDWLILATGRIDQDSSSRNWETRINSAGTITSTQPEISIEGEDTTNDRYVHTLARVYTLNNEENTFTSQSRRDSGSGGTRTYSAIFALNLENFESHENYWNEASVDTDDNNDNFATATEIGSVDIQPQIQGDVWALASSITDVADDNRHYKGRLQIDDSDSPGTQTSDDYDLENSHDSTDERPFVIQTVENLDTSSHNIDLDVAKSYSNMRFEDRNVFAITFQLRNYAPTQDSPLLISSSGSNSTDENLTCYNQSTYDVNGDDIKNIYNWYLDGNSFETVNLPFEGGSNNSFTRDYSGYSNNGTAVGATWNSTAGYDGRGVYEFDASSTEYIDLGNFNPAGTNITISLWYYWNGGDTSHQFLVGKRDSWDSSDMMWQLGRNYNDDQLKWERSGESISFSYDYREGEWIHLVLVQDDSNSYLYENGVLNDTQSVLSYGTDTAAKLVVGASDSSGETFNGYIDDFRIYNRSLSSEQVGALYNNQTTLIVSQETDVDDVWSCEVTPNDGNLDGTTNSSNNITILDNPPEIKNTGCFITGRGWVDCNTTSYNDELTLVRTNCSSQSGGSVSNVTFSLKNIQDDHVYFNDTVLSRTDGYWQYDFTDFNLNDSGDFNLHIVCRENPVSTEDINWSLSWGNLTVDLIDPSSNHSVSKDRFFNFTAQINCVGGECGNVNSSIYYKSSSGSLGSYGSGSDDSVTITSASTVINNYTYLTGNEGSGSLSIDVGDASEFNSSDEILVIQMQNYSNGIAGNYEFVTISNISGNTINLESALVNSYYSGSFNSTTATSTQVVRVPQYVNLTVNSGASIIASDWNGWTGGIVVFKASDTLNVVGDIDVQGSGFRQGRRGVYGTHSYGSQGESYTGLGSRDDSSNEGGGGGGQVDTGSVAGASGGGGAYGTAGGTGDDSPQGPAGGGGDGGSVYNNASLGGLLLGSGGGGGGDDNSPDAEDGSKGGGIIFITSYKIINTGSIDADGDNGVSSGSQWAGSGGGGSGGTVYLISDNMTLGSDLVSADGGSQACGGSYCSGAGGDGRIRLDYNNMTGTTTPSSGYNGTAPEGGSNGFELVSMVSGETPFYTTSQNPMIHLNTSCLGDLKNNSCNVTWSINSTGELNSMWDFYVTANATNYTNVTDNHSKTINLTITEYFPITINQIQCRKEGSWVNCSDIDFNDNLTKVRVNCVSAEGSITNATFNLTNIPDKNNYFYSNASSNNGDWWEYDNDDIIINDSGEFRLDVECFSDIGESDSDYTNWTVSYGSLIVDLIDPNANTNVNPDKFFDFTAKVSCVGGECGNVNVSLDPVNWWNLNWLKRKEINISSSANLADFPAYLNISKEENM